jgi:hypothetical protein
MPRYGQVGLPTEDVAYTFTHTGPSDVLLMPPSTAANTRPLCRISMEFDSFLPNSGRTIVRRGGYEHGELIGEYE